MGHLWLRCLLWHSYFWILPVTWAAQESELGKYLPFKRFGLGDFCLCFLLLIPIRAWGSGGAQGGVWCQKMILAIFTPIIRSLKGFCSWLERLFFLTGSEKRILPRGLRCFTCLTFSGRPISELSLFNEPAVETGCKWQSWHNNLCVHHPEKVCCFGFFGCFFGIFLCVLVCLFFPTAFYLLMFKCGLIHITESQLLA